MTRLLRYVALLTAFLVALPALHAVAQDSTEESIFDNPALLEGIQYGVSREWATTMDLSTPPAEGESVVFFVAGVVFEFDDDDHSGDAFRQLRDELTSYISDEFGLSPDEFTTEEQGDDEFVAHGLIEQGDDSAYFRYVIKEDDGFVFVTASATTDESSSGIADDLAGYMEDQDDDMTGLGEFNEDGTSTGGLWGFFPADDHELVADLSVAGDDIVYPEQEDES